MRLTAAKQSKLPTYLITGLLGSGKTSLLLHLLKQKPVSESWVILINEFGEIDIDGEILKHLQSQNTEIITVRGGCICCTAGYQLSQAIQAITGRTEEKSKPDKLWIEPTGLGHPAGVIDTLSQLPSIHLKASLAVLTPKQLTPIRWQKSSVMRDIATLADVILLSQTDLASEQEIETANQLLETLYPSKSYIWNQYNEVMLPTLENLPPIAFKILESRHLSAPLRTLKIQPSEKFIQSINLQFDTQSKQIKALGIIIEPQKQFNRVLLKKFFEQHQPNFSRVKGLVRTGKNWQLLQSQSEQLQLSDFAWRQDNRIEFLFAPATPELSLTLSSEAPKINFEHLPAGIKRLINAFVQTLNK